MDDRVVEGELAQYLQYERGLVYYELTKIYRALMKRNAALAYHDLSNNVDNFVQDSTNLLEEIRLLQ